MQEPWVPRPETRADVEDQGEVGLGEEKPHLRPHKGHGGVSLQTFSEGAAW